MVWLPPKVTLATGCDIVTLGPRVKQAWTAAAFARTGTFSPNFERCDQLREESSFPPNVSESPSHKRAGISAWAKKVVKIP